MGTGTVGQAILIAAPLESVWAVISDVERTGEWSPECVRCRWLDGADRPVVGARYRGASRHGWRRWSTTSTITSAEPGDVLEWDVSFLGRPVARWTYRLTAAGDGRTRLEECVEDHREPWLRIVSPWVTGSRDRAARNDSTIGTSLTRIKGIAEREHDRSTQDVTHDVSDHRGASAVTAQPGTIDSWNSDREAADEPMERGGDRRVARTDR